MGRRGFIFFELMTESILAAAILLLAGTKRVMISFELLEFEGVGSTSGALGDIATSLMLAVLLLLFSAVVFASIADHIMLD